MTLKSKSDNRKNATISSANEAVFHGVSLVMERHAKSIWVGTMTELTSNLSKVLNRGQRGFLPKSPSALRVVINRVINRLRNSGVGVKFGRTSDHSRTRFVRFAQ